MPRTPNTGWNLQKWVNRQAELFMRPGILYTTQNCKAKLYIMTQFTFMIPYNPHLGFTMAKLAARSPHERKIVGSNPAGSNKKNLWSDY